MRWDSIYLAGTGTCFPPAVSVETAIAQGRYDSRAATRSEQLSATVATPDQRSPDLAAAAARQALQRAGCDPRDVGVLLYAVLMHAGIDVWSSASYVQRKLGCDTALVAEVRSGCDGGLVGLELACAFLLAHPDQPAAVVCASDCFRDDVIDRWRTASTAVFGDGGSALVISRDRGFARLLTMTTITDPHLEALHRGDEQFGPFRHGPHHPINLDRRAREFLRTMPKAELRRRHYESLRAAVRCATTDIDVELGDVAHLVLPFIGRHTLDESYLGPLGLDIRRSTWEYSRSIGHLGAGDPFAGFNHLVESGQLIPGDLTLLLGVGAGMTCTVAVVETLQPVEAPTLPKP